jgi:hypothetical protein
MPPVIEKAVWLESMERVHNVIQVLHQLYDSDTWQGGILFRDSQGGFLLVVTLNPATYDSLPSRWENLFPANHLRSITVEQACFNHRRYHVWLGGETPYLIRQLMLLPSPSGSVREDVPSLAAVRAERDPPMGPP